jgi:hypothetical protein
MAPHVPPPGPLFGADAAVGPFNFGDGGAGGLFGFGLDPAASRGVIAGGVRAAGDPAYRGGADDGQGDHGRQGTGGVAQPQ